MLRRLALSSVAVAALALAAPAAADPITLGSANVGGTFTLNFDGFADSTTVPGLTGSIAFTLDSITANQYNFSYVVSNTTSGGLTSRISSFAFDTDPQLTGATSTGAYPFTIINGGYPNGIGSVDVCFKAGSSNACQGNSGGIAQGSTGAGTLSLSFANPVSSVTLSDFFVRYQGITGAGHITSASGQAISSSTTSGGTSTTSTSTSTSTSSGGTPVPAPGMLALFALALAGLGLGRRWGARERRAA